MPEKDADPETSLSPVKAGSPPKSRGGSPKNFVHFRLEVRSKPFNVFSAKKFPGLAESTALSRVVNEQGCRVRIRRDVRMRRRDKVSDSYIADDIGQPPSERYSTQQPPDRPRSTSNASTDVQSQYGAERRQSYHDLNYYQGTTYQQPHPQAPQSASSYTSHLSFGGPSTPHYQTPSMVPHPQTPVGHSYQQPTVTYPYAPHNHARHLSGPHNYGYSGQPVQQPTYGPSSYIDERPYPDSRRSSGGYSIGRSQIMLEPYEHSRSTMPQSTASSQMRSLTPLNTGTANQGPPSLPPIKALVHPPQFESGSETKQNSSTLIPPRSFSSYPNSSYGSVAYNNHATTTPQTSNPTSVSQSKRAYGEVFDATPLNQPMHSGMRPNTAVQSQDLPHIETADGEYTNVYGDEEDTMVPLVYKRADGSQRAKKCPSPRDRYIWNTISLLSTYRTNAII